jgi:hypothetical protein
VGAFAPLKSGQIMKTLLAALFVLFAAVGCGNNLDNGTTDQKSYQVIVPQHTWARVSAIRTFFAHQSVGGNLLAGVRDLQDRHGVATLPIVDIGKSAVPDGPVLAHLYVGQNGDPMSKIRGFRQALGSGLGESIDVAALKFCFWDIQKDTDVERVFEAYAQTIADMQTRFPRITFVHVTVPLFERDSDWRAGVRRLLSMDVPRTLDNAKRNALSERIRARYRGREPIFDLESFEAAADRENGGIPYLRSDYTFDGGHLNESARGAGAATFLNVVSEASTRLSYGSAASTRHKP